jgi:mannosidase alpha-like ER degradation enhancer 1
LLGNYTEFAKGVEWVTDNINFDIDARVNVFEVNIRLLGGLLSAHTLAVDPALRCMRFATRPYGGELLALAHDLGKRLLKAFASGSRLPYAWVNLRYGVVSGESGAQCTAGAGTLILEFAQLSNLTGDHRFFDAAHHALMALWSLRSPIGLQ